MPAGNGVIVTRQDQSLLQNSPDPRSQPCPPQAAGLSLAPALLPAKLTAFLPKNCSGLKPEWKPWGGAGDSVASSAWQD